MPLYGRRSHSNRPFSISTARNDRILVKYCAVRSPITVFRWRGKKAACELQTRVRNLIRQRTLLCDRFSRTVILKPQNIAG